MSALVGFDQDAISQYVRVIGSDSNPRWRRQYALELVRKFDTRAKLGKYTPGIGGYRVYWGAK